MENVKLRCVAFQSDDLGKDFTKGRVYESDDVAMETDSGRNLWCDGTFESLIRLNPETECFLYPLRIGEDAEYVQKFLEEHRWDAEYVVNSEFVEYPIFKVKLLTAYGVVLLSDDGLCLVKRIHDIRRC